ncbi:MULTISPECIES: desulfoferrodoxin family protein [Anaerostipes]|uniref:desulfoferrodoxin family protein n=1 Tax=Anaerostipes TaxID=207244 RepID=UPI00095231BF|nr:MULTISPECIES: desulfoferrodoxin family protein [Anaerostipes]MCI5622557.1 desulfoferrodoxin [Anaerostipes sp.]MDY2725557.1 desulfoferrodoxin family protein [Anaerostipes faecalis]OLR59045.1 desulfoferrodoxin [Anaerostipes sp. 494a]
MSRFYKKDKHILFDIFGSSPSLEGIEQLKANSTDAAGEKHVPQITVNGQEVIVEVGSVAHPMLEEHYIQGVYIETKNGGQLHKFQPDDEPKAVFTLVEGDELIAAYEYCNLHGLWKAEYQEG